MKQLSLTPSTATTNVKKNSTMASGTRGSSIPHFSTTGRATSLQHVLKNVLECDLTSPLYLSVLQHFGGDEDKFNVIDYFLCNQTYFENLSYSETVWRPLLSSSWLWSLTTGSFALVLVGCLMTPSRRCSSILLNSHACPWVLYSRNDTSLQILPWTCDKICMMMTRLACNQAIESSYWRMDNDSDVGLLMGYVLYWLPVELEFMDLDTFPCWFGLHPSLLTSW
jgi:hypothetical protein